MGVGSWGRTIVESRVLQSKLGCLDSRTQGLTMLEFTVVQVAGNAILEFGAMQTEHMYLGFST